MSTWKAYEVPVEVTQKHIYFVKARSVLEAVDKVEDSMDFGHEGPVLLDIVDVSNEVDYHGIAQLDIK